MQLWLDHLVICSPSLPEGTSWLEEHLHVRMQRGGNHPAMATHNSLLRIDETSYLEVIAPNPELPRPQRPRWFELDEEFSSGPAEFRSWVARTQQIAEASARSIDAKCDPGTIETMSRGELFWQITIPSDGRFLEQGRVPSLIQWPANVHPVERLPPSEVRLEKLILRYLPGDRFSHWEKQFTLEPKIDVIEQCHPGEPWLEAHFHTPAGKRTLPITPLPRSGRGRRSRGRASP